MKEKLSSTMEDYLETIAMLKRKGNGIVRVSDISNFLDVKKPTVNAAVGNLSKKGLVVHQRYGHVDLTRKGKSIASEVEKKHKLFFEFLTIVLDIDQATASSDACKMEHVISSKTFVRLTKFIQFINSGLYEESPEWLKSFKHYLKTGKRVICRMRKTAAGKDKEK
jgi:DtxR family transcriptional regulator, Mn-dependent transcriptional regulator